MSNLKNNPYIFLTKEVSFSSQIMYINDTNYQVMNTKHTCLFFTRENYTSTQNEFVHFTMQFFKKTGREMVGLQFFNLNLQIMV